MRAKIIYEDRDVLVCYKPAGLATQTARVGQQDLVSELKNYLASVGCRESGRRENGCRGQQKAGASPYLGVIHRLDQPVEGLLVFAKNSKAAAALSKNLTDATLNKHYYAVVCGQMPQEEGHLVDYLARDAASGSAKVAEQITEGEMTEDAVQKMGKDRPQRAVLHYHVAARGEDCSLLDVEIETGRFHQIRVQLSHAGFPILGDCRYGNEASLQQSRSKNVRNVALCAYRVNFKHPTTGREMDFQIKPEGAVFGQL